MHGGPAPDLSSPPYQWLRRFVGTWEGTDTIAPAPWNPKGGTATGRVSVRLLQGGLYAIFEWVQLREAVQVFEGHGVMCWSPKDSEFRMHWFDCHSVQPGGPATGRDEDGVLTLVNSSEQGCGRQRYTFLDDGAALRFQLDHRLPGGDWEPFMESRYLKIG